MTDTASATVGTRAVATVTFTDDTGDLADPTAVIGTVRNPNTGVDTVSTYGVDAALTRTSLGVFKLEFDLIAEGRWHFRVAGTGAVAAAVEGSVVVPESVFV